MPPAFRLRELSIGHKLGVTGLLLTLLIGLGASAMHLYWHYEPRDERPGLTRDDLTSAYHGLHAPSPLLASLERGHPETLPADQRRTLIDWLKGDRVAVNYDNIDLGDAAPAEIIAAHCLSCHSRRAEDAEPAARDLPLDRWDDVRHVAFARDIAPVPIQITAVSTHTHALSLGTLSLVVALLAWATSLPRRPMAFLVGLSGLALLADLAAWWLARLHESWVGLIIAGGVAYNGATILLVLLILLDVWLPRPRPAP